MSEHESFLGVTVDHLYQHCPGLQRSMNATAKRNAMWHIGEPAVTTVDPLGTDICGWCRSVYIAKRTR